MMILMMMMMTTATATATTATFIVPSLPFDINLVISLDYLNCVHKILQAVRNSCRGSFQEYRAIVIFLDIATFHNVN